MFFAPSFDLHSNGLPSSSFTIHAPVRPPSLLRAHQDHSQPAIASSNARPATAVVPIPHFAAMAIFNSRTDLQPAPLIPDESPVPYRSRESSLIAVTPQHQPSNGANPTPIYIPQTTARPSTHLSLPDHSPPAYFTSSPPKSSEQVSAL
ncbi:hypothetical protein BD324DRAFT_651038 [Kockovaella imperatae]|uniref:Uncharacterized protein n=1 Tax=Kockovaella imperatae TaxID=4999 RepID=A0A1Y1UIX3_9TREE|nr:hypothetical protein BD324DRAFT_651038 [Kockovaella imperatae]ORX37444.1 hypothetical protein BD324DRAFT_651038 [Kockovaella imperatae]